MNRWLSRLAALTALLAAALCLTPCLRAQQSDINNPRYIHLAWGIDIGSSIDMTTQDMSTLNADAFVGMRTPFFDALGVGAGLHAMVNNNSYSYPVYALIRTSFSRRPRLCFLDLRVGAVIDSFYDAPATTAFYVNPSIGVHLALGKNFHSFLSVGYCYNGGHYTSTNPAYDSVSAVHMANVRLGVCF